MKVKLLIFVFLLFNNSISAQLIITPGAELYMSGTAQLTLSNIDLVNNGSFVAGNGTVSFTGNSSSSISGSQPVQFYELAINKTAGTSVLLQRTICITQQISFTAGFLNLNNYNADLGTTGLLNGELETSRIISSNGGQVLFSTTLSNPASANPGNLGAIITSGQNLGNVIIRRGHQSQVNGYGNGNSILRYFDILPANNAALNATLRFNYFDGELNGLTESNLVFWKSFNNTLWTNEGFTSRNTTTNYVEKTGIPSFSRWTLSSIGNPLPVLFTLFNLKCEGNKIILNWKTAQEQNSSHFNIERSTDGIRWSAIGSVPAAGNSSIERSYSYTDNNPISSGAMYRIAEYDIDGRTQYTSIIRSDCEQKDSWRVWPNPVQEMLWVNITATSSSPVTINVFDAKGSLVRSQQSALLSGNNQLNIDMKNLTLGTYHIILEWGNGQIQKSVSVIKM
ncbi:MAG: T9SS type A sorting domain-containing protein [Bacteroidota bacterium]|nr:T9SS type A sorting domain-containing protein [Bacteroidota bacterium]